MVEKRVLSGPEWRRKLCWVSQGRIPSIVKAQSKGKIGSGLTSNGSSLRAQVNAQHGVEEHSH